VPVPFAGLSVKQKELYGALPVSSTFFTLIVPVLIVSWNVQDGVSPWFAITRPAQSSET